MGIKTEPKGVRGRVAYQNDPEHKRKLIRYILKCFDEVEKDDESLRLTSECKDGGWGNPGYTKTKLKITI